MNTKEIDLFERFKCRLNKELYDMVFINPEKVVLIGEENLIELFSNIYKRQGGIIEYVYVYKINDIKNDIFNIYNVIDNTINKIDKNTPLIILGAYFDISVLGFSMHPNILFKINNLPTLALSNACLRTCSLIP